MKKILLVPFLFTFLCTTNLFSQTTVGCPSVFEAVDSLQTFVVPDGVTLITIEASVEQEEIIPMADQYSVMAAVAVVLHL